jgi:hypothetical protein
MIWRFWFGYSPFAPLPLSKKNERVEKYGGIREVARNTETKK